MGKENPGIAALLGGIFSGTDRSAHGGSGACGPEIGAFGTVIQLGQKYFPVEAGGVEEVDGGSGEAGETCPAVVDHADDTVDPGGIENFAQSVFAQVVGDGNIIVVHGDVERTVHIFLQSPAAPS